MGILPGIRIYPTDANFVFFCCAFDADRVYRQLKERGILIRNFNAPGAMRGFMRVTVGTRDENSEFVEVLRNILTE